MLRFKVIIHLKVKSTGELKIWVENKKYLSNKFIKIKTLKPKTQNLKKKNKKLMEVLVENKK